jgi:hypothetical protein
MKTIFSVKDRATEVVVPVAGWLGTSPRTGDLAARAAD